MCENEDVVEKWESGKHAHYRVGRKVGSQNRMAVMEGKIKARQEQSQNANQDE